MEKEEKEMYVQGCLVTGPESDKTKRGKKRMRSRAQYTYKGEDICKKTFSIIYDIGRWSLESIRKFKTTHSRGLRQHGNKGKKPQHALTFADIKAVLQFVSNYAEEYGIPQPAAQRGRDDTAPIFLHSSTTKVNVHSLYKESCQEASVRCVGKSSFLAIWKSCLPHVKVATPRDDVCATCEKLRKQVMDSVSEEDKLQSADALKSHILGAQKERDLYNKCIREAKETSSLPPTERTNHYTFDFSQNVSIPHHSRQMGPVFFTSLRKVQIFGVRIDGKSQQYNFLIDENETIGADGTKTQGPNAVLSMLDHVSNTYGGGERNCIIHADNCPGQNKNQYVIGYLAWRVMTGRHNSIEYMMQVPGHSRCLVDSGFAHIKKLYRRSDCDTLQQLEDVVNRSSTVNKAIRYPAWCWRDWKSFLSLMFKPIPGIRKYQYFKLSSDSIGSVRVRTAVDQTEQDVHLLKRRNNGIPTDLPNIIVPQGLSEERAMYLHRTVRQYVRPMYQDVTCPSPII